MNNSSILKNMSLAILSTVMFISVCVLRQTRIAIWGVNYYVIFSVYNVVLDNLMSVFY